MSSENEMHIIDKYVKPWREWLGLIRDVSLAATSVCGLVVGGQALLTRDTADGSDSGAAAPVERRSDCLDGYADLRELTVDALNIRNGSPSIFGKLGGDSGFVLARGQIFNVLGKKNPSWFNTGTNWYRIEYCAGAGGGNRKTGWISSTLKNGSPTSKQYTRNDNRGPSRWNR